MPLWFSDDGTRRTCAGQPKNTSDVCFLKTVGDRIRYARERAGLSQAQLARIVGTTPGTIGDKEVNRTKASGPLITAISCTTGFSQEWLARGTGDPLVERNDGLVGINRPHDPDNLDVPIDEIALLVGMALSVLESNTTTSEALAANIREFYEKVFSELPEDTGKNTKPPGRKIGGTQRV